MPLSGNVTDLTGYVATLLRDEGITAVDSQNYIDALNVAQDMLAEMLMLFHEKSTISTVSGTRNYDVPDNYMSTYANNSLVYTDADSEDHTLTYTTYDNVRGYDDLESKTGTPTEFWIQNNDIYLYPIPDYVGTDNLELEHYRYLATLGGGTSARSTITFIYDTYTVLTSDATIFASGTFTVTMLDAVANGDQEVTIKNVGTGVITLDTTDSQVLDGDSKYYLYSQYGSVTFKSNGVNWFIINKV